MRKIIFIIIGCLLIFTLIGYEYVFIDSNDDQKDTLYIDDISRVYEEFNIMAHATGGLDGETYLNTIESLKEHYQSGTRIIEIDFRFSLDGELIGVHNWIDVHDNIEDPVISIHDYEQLLIREQYHGLTYLNLFSLMMEDYQDIIIVLDTKEEEYNEFYSKIVSDTESVDNRLLSHIVPQLYSFEMYDSIEEIYPFQSYVLTLYKTDSSNEEVYEFLVAHEKVHILTVSESRLQEMDSVFINNVNELGVYIFVHTINDLEVWEQYQEMGVYGIYSDFITQDIMDEHEAIIE